MIRIYEMHFNQQDAATIFHDPQRNKDINLEFEQRLKTLQSNYSLEYNLGFESKIEACICQYLNDKQDQIIAKYNARIIIFRRYGVSCVTDLVYVSGMRQGESLSMPMDYLFSAFQDTYVVLYSPKLEKLVAEPYILDPRIALGHVCIQQHSIGFSKNHILFSNLPGSLMLLKVAALRQKEVKEHILDQQVKIDYMRHLLKMESFVEFKGKDVALEIIRKLRQFYLK